MKLLCHDCIVKSAIQIILNWIQSVLQWLVGILAHSSLQYRFKVQGLNIYIYSTLWCWWVSSWTASFKFFHNISLLMSGLWLGHSKTLTVFFNHSLVECLVCMVLLTSCVTHYLLRFSCWTDVLTFSFRICYSSEWIVPSMMASCHGPDEAKQDQTMMLPSPCFTDEIWFLCWNAVFFFLQT